jgi:hypothetical protein
MWRLLEVVKYHIAEMNGINLATALHRLTKLAVGGTGGISVPQLLEHPSFVLLRETVVCRVEEHRQLMFNNAHTNPDEGIVAASRNSVTPAAVSNRTRAYAENGAASLTAERAGQPLFEVQCMSIVCWACATLRLHEDDLMVTIGEVVLERLDELKPFELSNMVWAYAKLSLGTTPMFSAVSDRVLRRRDGEFGMQCLSMIAWSFATAARKDIAVFSDIAREIVLITRPSKPQEIANTLWAYAKTRCAEPALFDFLADASIENGMLWTFKPQELSNTLWACATVGHRHTRLFRDGVAVAINKRFQLSPQNIANILWAYAKLQACPRSGLFPALLGVSVGMMPRHKPHEISAIVWAAAKDNHPACRKFFGATSHTCARRLHEFPPRALASMVEAFAVIGAGSTTFSENMALESVGRLHQFEPVALANLFRGAVLVARRSRVEAPADRERQIRVLEAIGSHMVSRKDELQPLDLTHIEHSLQLLGRNLRPHCGGLDTVMQERQSLDAGNSSADGEAQSGNNQHALEGAGDNFDDEDLWPCNEGVHNMLGDLLPDLDENFMGQMEDGEELLFPCSHDDGPPMLGDQQPEIWAEVVEAALSNDAGNTSTKPLPALLALPPPEVIMPPLPPGALAPGNQKMDECGGPFRHAWDAKPLAPVVHTTPLDVGSIPPAVEALWKDDEGSSPKEGRTKSFHFSF